MVHSASLVHDDVIDQSDFRRGKPSVNALWNHKKVRICDCTHIYLGASSICQIKPNRPSQTGNQTTAGYSKSESDFDINLLRISIWSVYWLCQHLWLLHHFQRPQKISCLFIKFNNRQVEQSHTPWSHSGFPLRWVSCSFPFDMSLNWNA